MLKEMSQRVCDCLREYDVLGRYGGEEFLVIIPDAKFSTTMIVAERICADLGQEPFVFEGHELTVTASLGVTCCRNSDEDLSVVLQRADEALYEAKNSGRNRVVGHA